MKRIFDSNPYDGLKRTCPNGPTTARIAIVNSTMSI